VRHRVPALLEGHGGTHGQRRVQKVLGRELREDAEENCGWVRNFLQPGEEPGVQPRKHRPGGMIITSQVTASDGFPLLLAGG
jgi:hypothetical protein